MKSIVIFALFLLFAVNIKASFGVDSKCEQTKLKARTDLKNGKVKFLIQGGIVSVRVKGQEVFEKRYQVVYKDLGCVVPNDICIADYNLEVGKYLDQHYGKSWRKEVRKDVQGI